MKKRKLSETHRKQLMAAKETVDAFSKELGAILEEGLSMSEAAKRLGISYNSYQKDIKDNFMRHVHRIWPLTDKELFDILCAFQTPQEQLFNYLFRMPGEGAILILEKRAKQAIEDMLRECLDAEEQKVVKAKFGFLDGRPKTWAELESSPEFEKPIKQFEAAMQKLYQPEVLNRLLAGYPDYFVAAEKYRTVCRMNENLVENTRKLQKYIREAEDGNAIYEKLHAKLPDLEPLLKECRKRWRRTKLSDTGMNPCLRHTLGKEGYQTFGDVLDAGKDNISQIKGFGASKMRELETVLAAHGLAFGD